MYDVVFVPVSFLPIWFTVWLMAKVKTSQSKCYHKNRKHLKSWEVEFTWCCSPPATNLINNQDKKDFSYCKVCHILINPHRSNLTRHAESQSHKNKISTSLLTTPLTNFCRPKENSISEKLRICGLQLAVCTACHFPTSTIDHLGEVVKKNGAGNLKSINLHRTKCTALIKQVISVGLQTNLKKSLQGKNFSIMMDESTDVSVKKLSAVCCRYYNEKQHSIVDAYLEIVETKVATDSVLFDALDRCLDKFGLKWNNCIGFGCDGASSMVGQYKCLVPHSAKKF